MALSKELLDILACPKCKGRNFSKPRGGWTDLQSLPVGLPDQRRHPRDADRRSVALSRRRIKTNAGVSSISFP